MKKWYPTNIEIIRNNFTIKNEYPLISNISYTIQYLEFLEKELKESNTIVITKMLIKNYILYSTSVLEALFYIILSSNNKINKEKKTTFSYLIYKMRKENKEIPSSKINSIKKLRNKIHIYGNYKSKDTDFNSFTKKDYIEAKELLKYFLNTTNITKKEIIK